MTTRREDSPSGDAPASPVERAFRLLRFIAEGGSTSNLSNTARQINVNRITLTRLLDSLEAAGLIEADVNGVHRLAMPFLTLAASALGSFDLTSRARQVMPGLVEATGLSAYLAVLEGAELVYLLSETPDTPLVSRIRVGSRIPAHRATPGIVMLAQMDPQAVRDLYDADGTLSDDAPDWKTLLRALDQVRENGCAWSFSGLEAGIDSCAAAVTDSRGNVLAALSVAGPNSYFTNDPGLRSVVEERVKAAARQLSQSIL